MYPPKVTQDVGELIIGLRLEGLTQKQIGDQLGFSQSVVSRFLRDGLSEQAKLNIPVGYKRCYRCKTNKLVSEFWKNKDTKDGFCGACKTCMSKIHKVNRSSMRWRVRTVYDLTLEEYEAKKASSNICPICHTKLALHLDHNEQTGQLREFICPTCNKGLGLFQHDPKILREAADYLERHNEQLLPCEEQCS